MKFNSKEEQEAALRENGLEFFGRISASVSHELNNVISIIDQTAGLLGDLLIGVEHGKPIPPERLQRISDSIRQQTMRGVTIIKRLNKFSHSVDHPLCEFELNELVENLTELTERFANLKRAEQIISLADAPINIVSDPYIVRQLLFICIRKVLEVSERSDTVVISVSAGEASAHLTVEGHSIESHIDALNNDYIELLTERLGGEFGIHSNAERTSFEFIIPLKKD